MAVLLMIKTQRWTVKKWLISGQIIEKIKQKKNNGKVAVEGRVFISTAG